MLFTAKKPLFLLLLLLLLPALCCALEISDADVKPSPMATSYPSAHVPRDEEPAVAVPADRFRSLFSSLESTAKSLVDQTETLVKTNLLKARDTLPRVVVVDVPVYVKSQIGLLKLNVGSAMAPLKHYKKYLHAQTKKVSKELQLNKATRPALFYSFDDFLFDMANYFPWLMKLNLTPFETAAARRKHIYQNVYGSDKYDSAHADLIRARVARWTSQSASKTDVFLNEVVSDYDFYLEQARFEIDASLDYLNDWVYQGSEAVPLPPMDTSQLQQTANLMDHAVTTAFDGDLLTSFNRQFQVAVSMTGPLRRPLEAIRHNVINDIKQIYESVFPDAVQDIHTFTDKAQTRLNHLYATIQHSHRNGQLVDRDIRRILADEIVKSRNSLHFQLTQLEMARSRLKTARMHIHSVWHDTHDELRPTPFTFNYWYDAGYKLRNQLQSINHWQQRVLPRCSCSLTWGDQPRPRKPLFRRRVTY
ncbi:uncharacterized protein BYT42DRAFT_617521 [Radiomyces spectabilis]|uniref:uncharacterized protein n=1 Tax=Radiomyces spectabilis TaxID=64574 RepID=UPI00221E9441|nr:uncharacterized protein BYT42DRAFT_617521 [Radiomyces spectabilis]KAI8369510.1 hypothetical protein BYT42DRAFT_617521 [Radiomyces spectabilis]